ncbi:hypothetical protein N7488_004869 [Penicillium malachiteum]|nr:hypothetical protein N7488_004869 [Penicillium malachiteum]
MDTYMVVLTLVILFIIQNLLNRSQSRSFPQTKYPVDHHDSTQTDSSPRPIRLVQINPLINEDTEIDLDIIAIHGFDARSPDTWTYKSKIGKPDVNWLKDPDMLPSIVGSARIFTCDWPSDFFESSSYVQKSFDDFALGLLAGIKAHPTPSVCSIREGPPVLFVASCLGGVVLIKALVKAQTMSDDSVLKATRGIVFLATPFRGTAFGDVAPRLLDEVKEHSGLTKLVGDFTRLVKTDGPFMAVFFETEKTHLPRRIGPFQISVFRKERLLVSENSSILDIVDNRQALNRSHVMMNKFEGPQDDDYDLVATKIKTMVNDIREGRPLEQAWAYVREKHYNDKKLEVVRLSNSGGFNRNLKMSECYVNLAIIEQPSKGKSQSEQYNPQHQSPFSLTGRLGVETPEKDLQVEVSHLFDSREDRNGRGFQARKILIRGQAGVGKTTLCKKMIHDFTRHDMWNNLFDRILWIPLRNLKLLPPECVDLRGFFQAEYFRNTPTEKERFSTELYRQVHGARDQRTLFVLDGLDEVHEALDEGHQYHDLLKELLDMPACIVTSRPRVVLPDYCKDQFDLELETVGFYPEQVTSYIEKTITNSQKQGPDWEGINELQSLLRQHQLLQQLVRIPIQLDALCFIWETDQRAVLGESKLETMTSIYQAIMRSLWRKDTLRSNMEVHNKPVTSVDIQNMPLDQLENFFPVGILEKLAIEGMVHDTISFTESQAMATPSSIPGLAEPLTAGMLAIISCLRTHDASTEDPVYHFIHLTFQEYFAARYFVKHWLSKTDLFEGQNNSLSSASSFIKHYKYDNRYDIFWRFVTGLFSLEKQGQDLIEFFEELQNEPIDLVGPVHQRLLMHCLSEVPPKHATFSARRNDLENKLRQWGVWEYRCDGPYPELKLLREAEFPEKSLLAILYKSLPQEKRAIVGALSHRPVIPLATLSLLCSWLKQDIDRHVKMDILRIIRQKSTFWDDRIVGAVKARFEDEDDEVQVCAIKAFGDWDIHTERSYPLDDLKKQAMNGRSVEVRLAAVEAIGKHRHLDPHSINFLGEQLQSWLDEDVNSGEINSGEILPKNEEIKCYNLTYSKAPKERDKILRALTSEELEVKEMTITVLGQQKDLPSDILQLILAHIESRHRSIQEAAFKAVQLHFSNDTIFELIELWLKNGKPSTQKAATSILRYWPQLPFTVSDFIKTQLKHQDETIRRAFIDGLEEWHLLNDEFLDAVTECLEDESDQIRCTAIFILERYPRFKDKYVDVFKSQVQHDEVFSCQREALRFLLDRLSFEDLGFDLISEWIRNPAFRSDVLEKLDGKLVFSDLSLEFLELLLRPCLGEDPWRGYRDKQATFSILATFHVADRDIRDRSLEAIINGLKNDDRDIRLSAAGALSQWSQAENHYFKEVLKHFSEQDNVREWPYYNRLFTALVNWSSSLGEDDLLVTTVAQALERKELEHWGFGARMLGNLRQPNDGLVNQICQHLNNLTGSLQGGILLALGCWSELKPPALQLIAKMLNNKSPTVQRRAFEILKNQSYLPLREMNPYMELIYKLSLSVSFSEHFYWLYENGKCTVMLGSRALRWKDDHGNIDTCFSLEPGTTERWRVDFVEEFPYDVSTGPS